MSDSARSTRFRGNETNTGNTNIDSDLASYLQWVRDTGKALINEPYDAYPVNQRFARRPGLEKDARRIVKGSLGEYRPLLDEAAELQRLGVASFPSQRGRYMNHYNDQVVRGMSDLAGENFTNKVLPALEAHFVRQGTHGGSQHRKMAAEAARDMQRDLSRMQGQFLHEGYEHAAQTNEGDRMRELRSAELMARLAQSAQSQMGQDVTNLMSMADAERQDEQRKRDFAYQQHLERIKHPYEQMNFAASQARGMPYSQQTHQRTEVRPGGMNSRSWTPIIANVVGNTLLRGENNPLSFLGPLFRGGKGEK